MAYDGYFYSVVNGGSHKFGARSHCTFPTKNVPYEPWGAGGERCYDGRFGNFTSLQELHRINQGFLEARAPRRGVAPGRRTVVDI